MRKAVFFFLSIFVMVAFLSCEKEKEPQLCTLYGDVSNKTTGEPIRNASVELLPVGQKSVTGSDGTFEFDNLEEGTYQLLVTKTGYKDYTSNDIVVKASVESRSHSIQIEKLPPALTIIDDSRNEINTINFGEDEGTTMRVFNIFNNGEDELNWSIAYQCEWIKSFSKTEGELKANATQSVVVTINRDRLNIGDNSTIVHVVSNNGSKQLEITATSVHIVKTNEASDIDSHTAVLNAHVVRNMNPAIKEYGFVYSKTAAPSLTNGAFKVSSEGTPQVGEYKMRAENLDKETTYYACAFVTNGENVVYGNEISFRTIQHTPKISLSLIYSVSTATTITKIDYRIESDGGLPVEEVGICWDSNIEPTKDKNYIQTEPDKTSYRLSISNLIPSTKYYIRAYIRNAEEEAYSNELSIETKSGDPSAETIKEYSYGMNYLTLSGTSSSPDNIPITRQGICYSTTSSTPTIYDSFVTADNTTSSFTCQLTNLVGCTQYYYRAFAENDYGIGYGITYTATTACNPATLKGYVYDQDGNPIKNAKVGVGSSSGTYNSNYSTYCSNTDATGYYEISFPENATYQWTILATAENFNFQTRDIVIYAEQEHELDFSLSLVKTCDVDLGTGFWAEGAQYMLFECTQKSFAGTTTNRNMRIRNYRSVPVSWSLTNIPAKGITFSPKSGTIPADSEISVTVTFTYPSTNNSQVVSLPWCSTGSKTYVWSWENIAEGVYIYSSQIVDSNHNPIGLTWNVGYSDCAAVCQQNVFINIGDEQGGFTLNFNQFVTY